jgi:hypothetical protein
MLPLLLSSIFAVSSLNSHPQEKIIKKVYEKTLKEENLTEDEDSQQTILFLVSSLKMGRPFRLRQFMKFMML